jgi:para-aminobenzoate synthetase component 1
VIDPARQILALAAGDPDGALAWLDGGDGRGWLGLEPDLSVEADSLAPLPRSRRFGGPSRSSYGSGTSPTRSGSPPCSVGPSRAGAWRGCACGGIERRSSWARVRGCTGRRARGARLQARLAAAVPEDRPDQTWPLGPLRARLPAEVYRAQVRAAQALITAGETYQVNLTQAFDAPWTDAGAGRSLAARAAAVYGAIRGTTPATMGALLVGAEGRGAPLWVLSNSPETLLAVEFAAGGDIARSWPIKGTRPRGVDPRSDAAAAAELLASAKDLAEHVMIVDLVRNDLGRLAVPGTVAAPRRPTLVSLPTVHHLISEVRCRLSPGWTLPGLLAAVFPAGSITGAPKRRTAEIIAAIEDRPRGLYCGAIVVLAPHGLRCSIPIRTGELDANGLCVQSGGGIVIDSDPEAERFETWAKVRAFDRR